MHHPLRKPTRAERLDARRQRDPHASKSEPSHVLAEFGAVAGGHRQHAIRRLTGTLPAAAAASAVGRRTSDEAGREARIALWEPADRICGKRLKAVRPGRSTALEKHGHRALDPTLRQRLRAIRPATIDRRRVSVRGAASIRKKRTTATKPNKQVPIRTFADGNAPPPGYLAIDAVAHGGRSLHGNFRWRRGATDGASGGTEAIPRRARAPSPVVEGPEVRRRQVPIPVRGIDAAQDSAFSNHTLLAYGHDHRRGFTRARAYPKNDPAWIEPTNGAGGRRCVGDDRRVGVVAGHCRAQLYHGVRRYVHYFPPAFKLPSTARTGAPVQKVSPKPITPCARLLGHAGVAETVTETLRADRDRLDPLERWHHIREGPAAWAAVASGAWGGGRGRARLEQFLAKLRDVGRAGEARPTPRTGAARPPTWRTRTDPCAGVWPEILWWLQEDAAATAQSLLARWHRH